jgi:hypothetical protein
MLNFKGSEFVVFLLFGEEKVYNAVNDRDGGSQHANEGETDRISGQAEGDNGEDHRGSNPEH